MSRARDDRLTFQGRLGAVTIEFSVDGAWRCWLAGLLACAGKHGGKARSDKFGARAMAGPGDWA